MLESRRGKAEAPRSLDLAITRSEDGFWPPIWRLRPPISTHANIPLMWKISAFRYAKYAMTNMKIGSITRT